MIYWYIISIHAPREGGDCMRWLISWVGCISIHAPREGGDFIVPIPYKILKPFQSTPPARGATKESIAANEAAIISIHAPREGGDC